MFLFPWLTCTVSADKSAVLGEVSASPQTIQWKQGVVALELREECSSKGKAPREHSESGEELRN